MIGFEPDIVKASRYAAGRMVFPLPEIVFHVFAFLLGAMVGSFLNVVIVRLPAGESVVRPRSKCPTCGDMIPSWLNVPVLSWIVLRGRCRACKTPISIRYPMVELMTALLFLAIGLQSGQTLATLSGWILAGSLIAITFIDIAIWEIPDEISVPGILIGSVLRPFAHDVPWFDGAIGAVIGASFLWLVRWVFLKLRGIEGMGLGDVKLIAMIGAFLGPFSLLPTILISSVVGSVIGIVVILAKKKDEEPEVPPPVEATTEEPESTEAEADEEDEWVPPKNAVPFGPFLALGALAELLIGPWLRVLAGFRGLS
jgi:leader peptidase (prepilin peptidase) / N-methyltransferase